MDRTVFDSFSPISYKNFLVKTLFNRAKMLCLNGKINEELAILEKHLIKNGYPRKFSMNYGKEYSKDD